MSKLENIVAPLQGKVKSITEVKDEVFSTKMLGDGIAIEPASLTTTVITSPVNGTVLSTHDSKHAIGILSEKGNEVLLHVGVDTVNLQGAGFNQFVNEGDTVKVGDKLLEVDFDHVAKNAPSSDVILIITNLEEENTVDCTLGNTTAKTTVITVK